ncbi:MAG TPA: helix-turn-helix domain-containing protein [Solirubrobacteraceae bacterium]|nr:helix-turn-helix domain-containing protein [Solirubrobacteraceae bacterium]
MAGLLRPLAEPALSPRPDITDPTVAKALSHPLRASLLAALDGRTASPSELAAEFDVPLGVLSYHVRRLAAFGFLRLVRRVPRRGAVEHYYTAVAAVPVSDEAWAGMPAAVRGSMLASALTGLGETVSLAAAQGGFDVPDAQVVTRRLAVDATGRREAAAELAACARRLEAIERAAIERAAADRAAIEGATDERAAADRAAIEGAADEPATDEATDEPAADAGSRPGEAMTVVTMMFRTPTDPE